MTSPSTTLSLVDTDPAELAVDAIVIGVHSTTGEQDATRGLAGTLLLASGAESIAAAFDGKLTETLALLGATGGPGEVIKLVVTASPGTRPGRSRPAASRSPRYSSPCRTLARRGSAGRGDPGPHGGRRGPAYPRLGQHHAVAEAGRAAGLTVEVLDEVACARAATAASSPSVRARRPRRDWSS